MTGTRFTGILAALALLLGLLSALDVVATSGPQDVELVEAEEAVSGAWTCPLATLSRTDVAQVVAAGAPGDSGAAADVTLDRFVVGSTMRLATSTPFSEQSIAAEVEGTPNDVGVLARWRRTPVVLSRSYTGQAEAGPSGTLAAPCISGTSSTWHVAGASTAGGAEARLVLANPFTSDAAVQIILATPDGPRSPTLLENVVVRAGYVTTLSLNEHAPEQRDLGLTVKTRAGRVVVEGIQVFNAAIGGIEGVSLVPAAPAAAETWTMPWYAAQAQPLLDDEGNVLDPPSDEADDDEPGDDEPGDDEPGLPRTRLVDDEGIDGQPSSWLWVTNPSDAEAELLITAHMADGSTLLDLGSDVVIPAGGVRRISLDGLIDPQTRAALTVASQNGVPVVASIAVQVSDDDEDRTGLTIQAGLPLPDAVWVVPSEPALGRRSFISLVNPAGEDAIVALSAWTPDGIIRPDDAQAIEVPAGSSRLVEILDLFGETSTEQVIFVSAVQGQVVAGHVGWSPDAQLDLVAIIGVPSSVWGGGALVPSTVFDPMLTTSLDRRTAE